MSTTLSGIGNRLWDAAKASVTSGGLIDTVLGTPEERAYRKKLSSEGISKDEISQKAKLRAEDFLPAAALMATDRASLAAQRDKEVLRLTKLPIQNTKTGAGTLAFGNTLSGQVSVKMPEEIPTNPTAFDLARQMTNHEVVEKLLQRSDFVRRQKGVIQGASIGAVKGITLGVVGQKDYDDPFTQAQIIKDPISKGEAIAQVSGELSGSFIPYGGIAKVVGSAFRTVPAINRLAIRSPFLFSATVSNLGEELIDMSVRKGTGQDYNESDFILGMAMGGAFEGVFAGVRAAKNSALIHKQLNTIASGLKEQSPKALYEAAKSQTVEGLDITYESLFKEHRLAYFRGQDGRPGIDRPAVPPSIGGGGEGMGRRGVSLKEWQAQSMRESGLSETEIQQRLSYGKKDFPVSGEQIRFINMLKEKSGYVDGAKGYSGVPRQDGTVAIYKASTGGALSPSARESLLKEYGMDASMSPDKTIVKKPVNVQSLQEELSNLNKDLYGDTRMKDHFPVGVGYGKDVSGNFSDATFSKVKRANELQKQIDSFSSIQKAKSSGQSFDEWVKGQGETVYRGGEKVDISKSTEQGISVSKSAEIAKDYGNVEQLYLSPTAKIAGGKDIFNVAEKLFPMTPANPKMSVELLKMNVGFENNPKIMNAFKEAGFDAIDYSKIDPFFSQAEIRALNPDILKTRSQLKAEWDAASSIPKSLEPLAKEGGGKMDKGTLIPSEIGEQRMPGIEGDANLRSDRSKLAEEIDELAYYIEGQKMILESMGPDLHQFNDARSRLKDMERELANKKYEYNQLKKIPVAKEEMPPVVVKSFSKKYKTDADVEIMFEPTVRTHLTDFVNKTLNARYIESFGDEGRQIAGMIDKADEIANIKVGIDINELSPILRAMTPDEIRRFPDVAEGILPAVTENEVSLANFWNTRRAEIAMDAQRVGLTVKGSDGIEHPFVPRENYYPRMVNETKIKEIRSDPEKANKLFVSMVENSNGRIKSVTEAKVIFNDIIKDRTVKRYGNLEKAREIDFLPDDMLIRDPRLVMSSYLQGARHRIADATTLGAKQEKALELIENARKRGIDADTITALMRRATGEEMFGKGEVALSRLARTYNNLTKLSLAAVTNIGDVVKPFVRTGEFINTMKGIIKSFTTDGAIQARRSGAVEANLRALLQDAGDTKLSDAFFKYTGFTFTETKIRSFNANAAIAHAEALIKRLKNNPDNAFAYRRLAQWIDNPDDVISRGFLTQSEKDIVGYRGIADTQPLRRLDLPFYWQKPSVKVLTQFKSFAYKHMTFMKKFVLDEAKQGNVRPLVAFLVMGQVVGETVGDMKASIRNRDRQDDVSRRIIDNYLTIGGIGLATDFLANLQYGSLGGGFLKFVAGPTLTDVDDWLTRIVSNNRSERVPKKLVGSLPLVGPAASQYLYPSDQTYNARTIPIAEDILNLMQPSGEGGSSNGSLPRLSGSVGSAGKLPKLSGFSAKNVKLPSLH